jgi:hypothetical protein
MRTMCLPARLLLNVEVERQEAPVSWRVCVSQIIALAQEHLAEGSHVDWSR